MMDQKSLSDSVQTRLSNLLNFPIPNEMIQMLMAYDKKEDLENHLCTLLDVENEKHIKFMNEFVQKKFKAAPVSNQPKNKGPQAEITSNNSKNSSNQPQKQSKQNQPKVKQQKQQQPQQKIQQPQQKQQSQQNQQTQSSKDKNKKVNKKTNEPEKVVAHNSESSKGTESSSGKKKKKHVSLYSSDGKDKVILLKGRHRCDCQASKHKLINNCLQCGRIVCEQEGSGPCIVCSSLVCSKEEKNALNAHTKQSDLLLQKLLDKKVPEPSKNSDLDKALEQRNKLLEFDKTSEKRTIVIDDESDYYSVNSVWLSEEERTKLRKKEDEARARKHKSAREKRYIIDFAGRQVREADEDDEMIYDINDETTMTKLSQKLAHSLHFNESEERFSSSLAIQPKFQENLINNFCNSRSNSNVGENGITRIQDKEFLEISDLGFCLSMHQPYASLLVAGIKIHEGRNWYTHHRGRLWIAAGAKVPSENEIQRCENFYRNLLGEDIVFPTSYPTGCLLGCVNVINCITQEEYEVQYPDGESDSPFVFICSDPVTLPLKFLISGKHKIYRLDPKIHQAALKALEKVVTY